MARMIIVGGGIAGFSAGIASRLHGLDATIYEMHTIPGGNCTSWTREGYLFEGGTHWLVGSRPGSQFHALWQSLGVLSDDVQVAYNDPFLVCEVDGQRMCLYRNPEKLRAHLLSIAPVDEAAIERLVSDIQGAQPQRLSELSRMTCSDYARTFACPSIRLALENAIGPEFNAAALIASLGCIARGDGGYPAGGSLGTARRMATRFAALGGQILYAARVQRVLVDNGRAVGVVVNGKVDRAECVMIASDTRVAMDHLLDPPLAEQWADDMRLTLRPMCSSFVGIGVHTDLSDLPEKMLFALEEPIHHGDIPLEALDVNNYAAHAGYAPAGCTALTIILPGDTYDSFQAAKLRGTYGEEKKALGDRVIHALTTKMPRIAGKVDVVDVATPLTYERYCGTYHGSWMSIVGCEHQHAAYPLKSETIKGLYFAGQRILPPGGQPTAADTGWRSAMLAVREMGMPS